MNDIEPDYNASWAIDFKDTLDDNMEEDFLLELFEDEEEEEVSDNHPLNELIKDIH